MNIRHGYKGFGKKAWIYLLILLVCTLAYAMPQGEADTQKIISKTCAIEVESTALSDLDEVLAEFQKLLPEEIRDTEDIAGAVGILEVGEFLRDALTDSSGYFMRLLALYVGAAALMALAELFGDACSFADSLRSAVAVCTCAPLLRSFSSMLSEASSGLSSGCEFFGGMIPLLCTASAAGGASFGAASSAASMSISLSFVSGVLCVNLFPLSVMIFITSMAASFDTGQGARRLAKSIRTIFNFLLGAATTLMVSTVALQGVICGAKDSVAIRSARYAIGGMVPAVSATVGATLGTLISGAGVLSSTMGASGVLALAVTVGTPLLRILLYRFAMQLAITFSGMIGAEFAERFLDSLRSAVDTVLSVLAATLVIFVLEVVILMKATVGI